MESTRLVGGGWRRPWWLGAAVFVTLGTANAEAQAPLAKLDQFVEQGLRDWKIPGLAVAVIRNDSVVFIRGYGVREVGKPARVDASTVFAIGSNSKAITAAALAMLVDEGRIGWDAPVASYLQGFEFSRPSLTASVTIRDLLSHRTGLSRDNTLIWATALPRAEILKRVRYLKPFADLRSAFQYHNIMYLVAGQVVPAVTGQSWDDFVTARIFRPLRMTSTSIGVPPNRAGGNVAVPHALGPGGPRPLTEWLDLSNAAPAGAVNSNLPDLTNWVRLQLGRGEFEGQRLYSEAAAREMQTPQMVITNEPFLQQTADAGVIAYALGWWLYDYRGRKVVEHAGATDGMSSLVTMLPAENLGVIILTNALPHSFNLALRNQILDAYLGGAERDWNAEYLKRAAAASRGYGPGEPERAVPGTKPSLALAEYQGRYHQDYYGDVEVSWDGSRLGITLLGFKGTLSHWHYDTFAASWERELEPPAATWLATRATFSLDARGRVRQVTIRGLGDFARVVPKG